MSAARPEHPTPGGHTPVLLQDVLEVLRPRDGAIFVDGTFGRGGTSTALLDAADCSVWGIDRDPEAVAHGKELSARYPGRLTVIEGRFGDMDRLMSAQGIVPVDGVTLDLGVSSPQLDQAERGFSFRSDGPLDMRMAGPAATGEPSAAEVVNSLPEAELADIIWRYGEERKSRRIAHAIVARRAEQPLTRTGELAELVRKAAGPSGRGVHPATRTFQALRIYVNDELGELDRGLIAAEAILKPGGHLAVIAFHSLEDRRVKSFLRQRSGAGGGASRHLPEAPAPRQAATFALLNREVRKPGAEEERSNPRARSARLRAAERTAAAPWPAERTGDRA